MKKLLVHAQDLKKTFYNGKIEIPVLRGINFELYKGEFVALVGPSGSGKSTLLNLIGALDTPSSGQLEVLGHSIAKESRSDRSLMRLKAIGFVFQAYNLIPVLSAQENIEFILELQGVDGEDRHKRSLRILAELGLSHLAHRRPLELSGGEQQRVAVARAIVSHPQLVLADEPTANLDGSNSKSLMLLMKTLRDKHHMTFLFSTHDQRVIEFADRVVTLTDGLISSDEQIDQKDIAQKIG